MNGKSFEDHTSRELMHILGAAFQMLENDIAPSLEELSIAKNRVKTVQTNMNNEKLSDLDFRDFVKTIDFFKM
jgi:hypothetical protein